MRPYYQVQGRKWEECAKEIFKVVDVNQLFKGCKYMENYVLKYEKLPEYVELLLFYHNRYIESGKAPTLPFLTVLWTRELAQKFNKAAGEREVGAIIKIIEASRPV